VFEVGIEHSKVMILGKGVWFLEEKVLFK
jgi:hypothetical protein